MAFSLPENEKAGKVEVRVRGRTVASRYSQEGRRIRILLKSEARVEAEGMIEVRVIA